MAAATPIRVFYSYAHADRDLWLETVRNHLYLPQKRGWTIDWSDQDILPGENWSPLLIEQLTGSHVAVMLVTANFFAAQGCQEEVKLALDLAKSQNLLIFPILLSECLYELSDIGHIPPALDSRTPIVSPDRQDLLAETARKFVAALKQRWPDLEPSGPTETAALPLVHHAADPPKLLPHLADRVDECRALKGVLSAFPPTAAVKRTILIAASGPENESHEGFSMRLHKSLIRRELNVPQAHVQHEELNWAEDYNGGSQLRQYLTERARAMDRNGQVVVLTTMIDHPVWPGYAAFGEFLDFWNEWQAKHAHAFIVAQFFRYRLWPGFEEVMMRLAFRKSTIYRRSSLVPALLPAFKRVPKLAAQQWADKAVEAGVYEESDKPYLRTEIGNWYRNQKKRRNTMSMQDLTEHYNNLLKLRHPLAPAPVEMESVKVR